jgi:hypothetical protein
MEMDAFRRRELLHRGGLIAAGAGLASLGSDALLTDALAAAGGGLTRRRRATYVAVVEAVGSVPGTGVDARRAGHAARLFERYYAAQADETRAYLATAFDAIEASVDGGFSDARVARRVAMLRSWAHGPRRKLHRAPRMPNHEAVRRIRAHAHAHRLPPDGTGTRAVPLAHRPPPPPHPLSRAEARRAGFAGAAITAAAIPFSLPGRPEDGLTIKPVVAL